MMITKKTAAKIWSCYREIDAAEKLLVDMAEEGEREKNRAGSRIDPEFAKNLRDAFGHKRNLQLGVPSGENGHRLFDVDPDLAEAVIRTHIGKKRAALVSANEEAALELAETGLLRERRLGTEMLGSAPAITTAVLNRLARPAEGGDEWPTGDEEGLTPSQIVDLGNRLRADRYIGLHHTLDGWLAQVGGKVWSPYVLLTELLEDLGKCPAGAQGTDR